MRVALRRRVASVVVWALFFVLAWAAAAKLVDPAPATRFLGDLIYFPSPILVRAIAISEALVAVWLVSGVRPGAALAVVACMFLGFAITHVFAWSEAGPSKSCGCLGAAGGVADLPHWAWIAGNLALAGLGLLLLVNRMSRPEQRSPA